MRTWSAVRSRRWACSWEASWSTDSPRLSPTQISGDTSSSASRFWPLGALCSRTSTRTSLPPALDESRVAGRRYLRHALRHVMNPVVIGIFHDDGVYTVL